MQSAIATNQQNSPRRLRGRALRWSRGGVAQAGRRHRGPLGGVSARVSPSLRLRGAGLTTWTGAASASLRRRGPARGAFWLPSTHVHVALRGDARTGGVRASRVDGGITPACSSPRAPVWTVVCSPFSHRNRYIAWLRRSPGRARGCDEPSSSDLSAVASHPATRRTTTSPPHRRWRRRRSRRQGTPRSTEWARPPWFR